ncbi:10990_t:CDS:2, partial [Diversispora eburnea]
VLSEKGIVIKSKPRILIETITIDNLVYKDIQKVNKKLEEATTNGEELVVCILDKKTTGDKSLYAVVKRTCLTTGVISQCFLWSSFIDKKGEHENKIRNVFSMIAPKLNTKLGGVNCSLSEELNFNSKKAMIMGADVYHPGPVEKANGHPSVAAVCASMNSDATKYAARYRLNEILKNETIEELSEMTKELLDEFKKRNEYLPDHIIFYRDGVAEGQFEKIMKEEVKVLKDSLHDFYDESDIQEPKITFLIMQKRHHTRFAPVNKEEANPDTGNSLPGTIIDLKIVVADEFSFFLLSQALVQKGTTARSAYYRILLNEGDFTADEIQQLTYNLCYLSARCSVSISQVAPACYAHHIANQARYLVDFLPYNVANANRGNGYRRGGRGGLGGGRVGVNNSSHQKRPLVRNGSWVRVMKDIENKMWFL